MHTVHYTKHFLTGNLAGLEIKCKSHAPDAWHAQKYLELIQNFTKDDPGEDCVTGAKFYVTLG